MQNASMSRLRELYPAQDSQGVAVNVRDAEELSLYPFSLAGQIIEALRTARSGEQPLFAQAQIRETASLRPRNV